MTVTKCHAPPRVVRRSAAARGTIALLANSLLGGCPSGARPLVRRLPRGQSRFAASLSSNRRQHAA